MSSSSAVEAAHRRASIRSYVPDSITREELDTLLGAAAQAPSAYNVQPWRFVVVQDADLKNQLSEAAYGQPQVNGAPAVIAMYTDMGDVLSHVDEIVHPGLQGAQRENFLGMVNGAYGHLSVEAREAFGATQGGIALGYLLLLAETMGFATSPMLGFEPGKVKSILGLPSHVHVGALVAIGRPAGSGFPKYRHSLDRIVSFR